MITSREGKTNKKVKTYLKGQTIQAKLQSNNMKLVALSKKLKVLNSDQERHHNNKLYRYKQKAFYTMLHMGGEGVIQVDDPPKKEEVKELLGKKCIGTREGTEKMPNGYKKKKKWKE